MKLLPIGFTLLFFCSLCSCTKTDNVKTTVYDTVTQIFRDTTIIRDTTYSKVKNPIVGLWVGTWKNVADPADSFYYTYAIDANHTMLSTSIGSNGASDAAEGPWQLSGTSFTATITELDANSPVVVQQIAGIYDSTAGTLTGSGTFSQGGVGPQTFLLFRVQ